MEEKYLYTIAIIVIFAGFLFTSVGNYTGYDVRRTDFNTGEVQDTRFVGTGGFQQSSDERRSGTAGFRDQEQASVDRQTQEEQSNTCQESQEGTIGSLNEYEERVSAGTYDLCSNGKWVKMACEQGQRARYDRSTGEVVCESRDIPRLQGS